MQLVVVLIVEFKTILFNLRQGLNRVLLTSFREVSILILVSLVMNSCNDKLCSIINLVLNHCLWKCLNTTILKRQEQGVCLCGVCITCIRIYRNHQA